MGEKERKKRRSSPIISGSCGDSGIFPSPPSGTAGFWRMEVSKIGEYTELNQNAAASIQYHLKFGDIMRT